MFVQSRLMARGAVVLAAGLMAAACDDPEFATDLRPEGDPEVLAVLVMNDAEGGLYERATFCKAGDPKRPGLGFPSDFTTQQICPEDLNMSPPMVEDAVPTGWYVRIIFDELLDPDVEELIPITEDDDGDPATPEVETGVFTGSLLNTQPVVLRCTAPGATEATVVPYDGYYTPNGNTVTWPIGPSLLIQPLDPSAVATGSTCSVEILDVVKDKDGNTVPSDQRGTGDMYGFKIAALALVATDPEPGEPGDEPVIDPAAPLVVTFNGFVDAASLDPATEITITEKTACDVAGGTEVDAAVADAGDGVSLAISLANPTDPMLAWEPESAYEVTFSSTAEVSDFGGGTSADLADFTICFTTSAAE